MGLLLASKDSVVSEATDVVVIVLTASRGRFDSGVLGGGGNQDSFWASISWSEA